MSQKPKQKQPRQTKNKAMLVRLTSYEKEVIAENAKRLNMNISKYLLTAGLNNKLLAKRQREALINKDLIFELARIGANVNQIAKYANQNKILDRVILGQLALINDKLAIISKKETKC